MENDLIKEIEQLKKEQNAVILAHYYTLPQVQKLADFVGDSYYLAKVARNTNADTVVFCGVAFMGESVKILNPEKRVLMPDMSADCPMAHMADQEYIKKLREQYEDLAVVCYINSTAHLKCMSDVCVTSANAVDIVKKLPNKNILFIPDENLGRYVAKQVPEKNIILNDGRCPIHAALAASSLEALRQEHPEALVLAHPECREDILALSDYIGSTSGILNYVEKSDRDEFIICTEQGVNYPIQSSSPNKKLYFPNPALICPDMKLCTPERILHVLKTGENQVAVAEDIRKKALVPLDKMLELGK